MPPRSAPIAVILNVYDLSGHNGWTHSVGLGAYHTGIEIQGVEYSFGGHDGSHTGVFSDTPKAAAGCIFRESIVLGEVTMSPQEIRRVIDGLKDEFPGNTYHILKRNCNHFTNAVSERLLGKKIPSYINRAARMGGVFSCFLPSNMANQAPVGPGASGSGAAASSGSASSTSRPAPSFSGKGYTLSSDSAASTRRKSSGGSTGTDSTTTAAGMATGSGATADAERQRRAQAALARLGGATAEPGPAAVAASMPVASRV